MEVLDMVGLIKSLERRGVAFDLDRDGRVTVGPTALITPRELEALRAGRVLVAHILRARRAVDTARSKLGWSDADVDGFWADDFSYEPAWAVAALEELIALIERAQHHVHRAVSDR